MPSNNSNGYQQFNNGSSHGYPEHSQPLAMARPYSADELSAKGCSPPPLKLNDKIVWISDNGPEYGVVKWVGKFPNVGEDWMAGVEFVNAVGSGTGLYNDYKLFEAKNNHASFVPIVGLMKASDFTGTKESKSYGNIETEAPTRPRRIKKTTQESYKFYADKVDNYDERNCNQICNDLRHESSKVLRGERLIDSSRVCDAMADLNVGRRRIISNSNSNDSIKHLNYRASNAQNNETSPNKVQMVVEHESSLPKSASPLNFTYDPKTSPDSDELFEIGTVVEVRIAYTPYYGVIKWLGFLKNDLDYPIDSIRRHDKSFNDVIVGIELEEEISSLSNGSLNGKQYFSCSPNKAYFTELQNCLKDSRFGSSSSAKDYFGEPSKSDVNTFGAIDCPTVLGDILPLSTSEQLTLLCGKNRGIQGNHNSCYLDATLFAMFACSTVFESLLHRPKGANDIPEYNEVQRILKEEIVNPLRKNYYVRADRVMKLREILERISSVRGLTTEEKDPEEFLDLLLNEILKTEPFLKLTSGESCFYQLFVEKDENLQIPTVQQLFDQSFLAADIKLREIPPCLIIQMPRFGRDFKMYQRVIPSAQLDITNVLENSPRQCIVCGKLAEWECKECFGEMGEGLDSISFCSKCLDTAHVGHKKRMKHKMVQLTMPNEFTMLKEHTNIPRVVMNLFAVLCIETSHYVSFVKCGNEPDSPWCFFDSMADRKGEQDGYNIPEVLAVPNLKFWQNEGAIELLTTTLKDDKLMPELPRRLLSDAYICFYSSSEVLRYR